MKPKCPAGHWENYRKGFMRTYYHGLVHRYGQKLIREALDEMEETVQPELSTPSAVCVVGGSAQRTK